MLSVSALCLSPVQKGLRVPRGNLEQRILYPSGAQGAGLVFPYKPDPLQAAVSPLLPGLNGKYRHRLKDTAKGTTRL